MPSPSSALCQKHSQQQDTGSLFPTSLPALVICALFGERHSDRCVVISHCGFSFFLREIPLELQRLVHGGHLNLDMEDHQDQEYVKPRLRFKAFSGEGQKLGR